MTYPCLCHILLKTSKFIPQSRSIMEVTIAESTHEPVVLRFEENWDRHVMEV